MKSAVTSIAAPLLVAAVTLIAFAPVLQNGFTNWDDPPSLLYNPNYRGLSWPHLLWMFTTFQNSLYRPLTWMTLGADYLVWGMNPAGYHLSALLFHAANAVLFYFVALKLLSTTTAGERNALTVAAATAALLFAVHPLQVEAVAWTQARENVVAGFFFLLTLICYLKAVTESGAYQRWMIAAVICYGLCLLGKGAFVTLPIGLLILDFYPLRRLDRAVWIEKAPFFAVAFIGGLIALYGKQHANLLYGLTDYTLLQRFGIAAYGLLFYLWKTIVPVGLSPLYELPQALDELTPHFAASAAAAAAVTVVLFVLRRRFPAILAAWLWYVALLAPTSGVMQNGLQIAADRYTYLPLLAVALLTSALLLFRPKRILLAGAAAAFVVIVFAELTWEQAALWRDSTTLWTHAIAVNPKSYVAHHFLGSALLESGNPDAALEEYRKSRDINPRYASAYMSIAYIQALRGDSSGAIENYRIALKIFPESAAAHFNLANQLFKRGDLEDAMAHYADAVRLNPNEAAAHNNLGFLLARKGDLTGAEEHFQAAIRLAPDDALAHYNLGRLVFARKDYGLAVEYFRTALKLKPESPEIRSALIQAESRQNVLLPGS
ncbi:MAG TPA: tetratricopeptide repeat protein [Candidatus Binatia bacterium]|jgi:tetratricopeptide (TPR) repeat protein